LAEQNPKLSLWTAPAKIKTSYKWLIFALLLSGYLVATPWLLTQLGSFGRLFVFALTLPAAFFWGMKGGIVVSLATSFLALTMHVVMGVPFSGGAIGPIFLLLINVIVGWMCDLSLRLEKELQEKGQAEMELQRHKVHLEEMIRERTEELTRTNRELQQEIAERRQVTNALRESEEKYRLLVETANEAIFIAQDGAIKFPNPKVIEITGYSEKEVMAMPFVNLIHPDDREMVVERHLQRLHGKHPPSDYSFRIINKAGSELWVQINAAPITWEGRPATINLIRDVTEQKQLGERLRQSQKIESIGTLAGGIAHEFNNILSIIIGNTELALCEVSEQSMAADHLQEIRSASLRAKDVVNGILSFARIAPAERKPVRVGDAARESLKLLRAAIPATIDIRQHIACDGELILADQTEIHQVLMNLCTNAAHAMGGAPGILRVALEPVHLDRPTAMFYDGLNPGRHVRLSVADFGRGIDPKVKDRIFDPYFTTKEIGQGLGMGLAVVYGIVKKNDGAIRIESQLGQGTTVEVLFPQIEAPATAEAEGSEAGLFPIGTERILLVDDEASLVEMTARILEKLGYTVVIATSSSKALRLFQSQPERFDLVITDMAMPEMAGDRLAREIFGIRPEMPILLCTGYSDRIDEKGAAALGIAGYCMKPIVTETLAHEVRQALDTARLKG
jgi:two-component system, cell cycle sensor histidine kinase and response regulator CckA